MEMDDLPADLDLLDAFFASPAAGNVSLRRADPTEAAAHRGLNLGSLELFDRDAPSAALPWLQGPHLNILYHLLHVGRLHRQVVSVLQLQGVPPLPPRVLSGAARKGSSH